MNKVKVAKNLLLFIAGIIFCICAQNVLKYNENELAFGCTLKSSNKVKILKLENRTKEMLGCVETHGGVGASVNNSSSLFPDSGDTGNGVRISGSKRILISDKAGYEVDDKVSEGGSSPLVSRLFIVVMSSPLHLRSRNIIRKTWALNKPQNTLVYFAIGTDNLSSKLTLILTKEKQAYGDLLLLKKFTESYSNLTKKLLAVIKWVEENLQTDYFMKVDEDSFVRVDEVLKALDSKPKESVYWGFFSGGAPVMTQGKWAERDYFLCDNYLPYAVGGGYVLSADLVHYLSVHSDKLLVFKNEDVSLGTWLAPLNISRIHDPNFNTAAVSRGCFNTYIVSHSHTISEMILLNITLYTTGRLCTKEWRYYNSYIYNWKVPPYYCCQKSDSSIP